MKKRIFFFVTMLTQLIVFSQDNINYESFAEEIPVHPKIINNEFCSQINTDPEYFIFPSMGNWSQLIATDLFVEPNQVFTLEEIIVDLTSFQSTGVDSIDVIIWSDESGLPNFILNSELSIIPSSITIVGTDIVQGNNVYETVIDLPNPFVLEGGIAGTTYWVQLFGNVSMGGVGWHSSTVSIVGYPLAVNGQGMGWIQATGGIDGAYIFAGDCSPVLGVEDNISEQIAVFPNPTRGFLNIKSGLSNEILGISLFDLSGKKIGLNLQNEGIDISNLENGMYFLIIETTSGSKIEKIIKN
jgi:hypothetical protein